MQGAYIGKLMELAQSDSNILHLLADSGTGYDELFKRNFPKQIFNFGIAEENMVAAAAGLATVGKMPFVFTAGAFLAYRTLEFIRDDICFQNLNVKIVGMGSGLSWSSLGPTHHTTEDIAVLRGIPNLMILSPATPLQAKACVELAYQHMGPVYIRLGMNNEKEFYDENYEIDPSKCEICVGNDFAICTTGSILDEVMKAVVLLNNDGIYPSVYNVCVVKPFKGIDFRNSSQIFCVEEHNRIGGLNSIISEYVASKGKSIQVVPIGLNDCFAHGYGNYAQVRKANHLDGKSIYERIKETYNE